MSERTALERGYRLMLACYPRSFRRENAEEMLAVLLDTAAAAGQARVGLAEVWDLVRGGVRMRLWPAAPRPRAVRAAVTLMLAGAGIITDVQEISGGRVKLRAGTLYTALDRLRADGLIGIEREEVVASRLRRYYQILPAPTSAPRPRPAAGPDLCIGDADREATAAALGEHFARGRLTLEELTARLDVALTATRQSEIAQTTRDLPHL